MKIYSIAFLLLCTLFLTGCDTLIVDDRPHYGGYYGTDGRYYRSDSRYYRETNNYYYGSKPRKSKKTVVVREVDRYPRYRDTSFRDRRENRIERRVERRDHRRDRRYERRDNVKRKVYEPMVRDAKKASKKDSKKSKDDYRRNR